MLKTHYLFVSAVLQTYINITNLYLCYLRFTFTSIKVTGSKLNHVRIIFLKVCVHCHLVENHYIIITYSSRLLTSEHYSHFLQISLVCLIFFHMYCATAIPVFVYSSSDKTALEQPAVRCLARGYILIPFCSTYTALHSFI